MLRSLIITTLLLLLSGCGVSNLTYQDKQLILQVDKEYLQLDGELVKVDKDSFGSLFITQKILRLDNGHMAVYEDAMSDHLYEFEPGITKSIKVIFNAKSVIIAYAKNSLYAYQLILKDEKILNLIAQQSDSQRLRMVYGMDSTQLDQILKKLDLNTKSVYYRDVMIIENQNKAILSKWTVQNVHFFPLIVPLARFSGM